MSRNPTVYKIQKYPVTAVKGCVVEIRVGGPGRLVFTLLTNIFLETGVVFAGSVRDLVLVGAAACPPISERDIGRGLAQLQHHEYLWRIGEDMFVPRDKFLDLFS